MDEEGYEEFWSIVFKGISALGIVPFVGEACQNG